MNKRNIFSAVILTAFVASFALAPSGAFAQTQKNRPPVISGISAPTVLNVDAEGTWAIKAYDPENGNLSYSVDWGDAPMVSSLKSIFALPEFVQETSFSHTYAAAGTYTVKFTVKDESGATAKSSATVHVRGTTTSALKISNVEATSTKPTRATITWDTNKKSNSILWLSKTSPIDTSKKPYISRPGNTTDHKIELNRLTPDTTYYAVVKSSKRGASDTSSEFSFKTPPLASQAPVIKSVDGPSSLNVDQEGTWTLNAYDPKNTSLSYSVKWGDEGSAMTLFRAKSDPFVQTSTFSHTYAEAGTYTIVFTAKNEAGLTVESKTTVEVTQPEDDTAPVLSAITAASIESDQITLTWTTDEDADSALYYSTTSPVVIDDDENTTAVTDLDLVTSHSLSATDLTASTTYHFLIQSKDSSGNVGTSSQFSFTTSGL